MSSILRASLAVGTIVAALSASSTARADEPQAKPAEPSAEQRTAWPIVLGATSVVLGATSAYFLVQRSAFEERGVEIAKRVPQGQAPCESGGDPEFCGVDGKARLASTMALVTAGASIMSLGAAIALYVLESKPSPSRTAITPVVAPGYGGAALATTF
jgi:hypothetical protein